MAESNNQVEGKTKNESEFKGLNFQSNKLSANQINLLVWQRLDFFKLALLGKI